MCQKLKAHQQMQRTGAMENDFGCVPAKWKARLRFSRGKDRITFGKMSIQYCQLIEPALTVVDAIVAMDGPASVHADRMPVLRQLLFRLLSLDPFQRP